MVKKIFIAVLFAVLLPMAAAPITIAWDANPVEEQVTEYYVYFGDTSRADPAFAGYSSEILVAAGTEYTFPEGTFQPGSVTYFAVTASNSFGLRSDYSNEVVLDMSGPEYVKPTAPIISTVTATVNPDGTVTVVVR